MIGQLCTCDVENYGDILYPVVFQKMASRHFLGNDIAALAFLKGEAPCGAGFAIRPVSSFIHSHELSQLVIGGGDILRTDVDMVAGHYCPPLLPHPNRRRRLAMWAQERFLGRPRTAAVFRRRFMAYTPDAPFILDRANFPNLRALAYYSCGVPFPLPAVDTVRRAFESATFVNVRDFPSLDKLRAAGVSREIEVSPDVITALADFFPKNELRIKGAELLAARGVEPNKKVICFQSNPQPPKLAKELLQELRALKKNTGAEIVLLPLGHCHNDGNFLRALAGSSAGELVFADITSVHEAMAVIAASSLFVGTSMHGNITAFSFGLPHLFGPIAVEKVHGFLDVVGLDRAFQLDSWAQLTDKTEMALRLPPDFIAAKSEAARQRVRSGFEKLVSALKAPAPQSEAAA